MKALIRIPITVLACMTATSLALAPRAASAQNFGGGYGNGFGGATTFQGDVLRGEGFFLYGAGQYNLATATAISINTDTAIRWNQYLFLSAREASIRYHAMMRARAENIKTQWQKIITRRREAPTNTDLMSGNALNQALTDLLRQATTDPSSFRNANVPLPGATLKKIPFVFPAGRATFSMERLINREGVTWWPLAMRNPEYDSFRRTYERAIASTVDKDIEHKLDSDSVKVLDRAIEDLEIKYRGTLAESDPDFMSAKRHVEGLKQIPAIFRNPKVEKSIAAIETYAGTTVYDLIKFMDARGLQFASSDTPEEKELFRDLYVSLSEQREKSGLVIRDKGADDAK